jgi:hypothetical protein
MIVRSGVLVALVLAGVALPVAFSARRLQVSQGQLTEASARLERIGHDARRVVELRARQERVAERKRPKQDVIARVNEVLGTTGIPASQFGGLRLESDSDAPGSSGGGAQPSDMVSEASEAIAKAKPIRTGPKVGRNDPCPCGSGKKYKHCCGKNG